MAVFGRQYELVIGSPSHTYKIPKPGYDATDYSIALLQGTAGTTTFDEETSGYIDHGTIPAGVAGVSITDLQMEAQVNYGSEKSASSGQKTNITVYNVSPEVQKFVRAGGVVFLKAGYEESIPLLTRDATDNNDKKATSILPTIMSGVIESVLIEKKGQDTLLKMEIKDAAEVLKTGRVSESWEKETSYLTIINDMVGIAAGQGIPLGHFIDSNGGALSPSSSVPKIFPIAGVVGSGYSLEGHLLTELVELCTSVGYQAYISVSKLYIEPVGTVQRPTGIILESKNIKGQVRPEEDSTGASSKGTQTVKGVKVNTFLNGAISTNKFLDLRGMDYQGLYKITAVAHKLSYEGALWDTEITATRV